MITSCFVQLMRLSNGDLRGCVEQVRRQAALSIVLACVLLASGVVYYLPYHW